MNFDDVFPPSALEDNRAGRLTPSQKRGWANRSWDGRKSQLSFALIAVVIGTLVLIGAKKTIPAYEHYGVPALCYLIAVVLVVRSATGRDKITEDVRAGKLESVEGAITKRVVRPVNTHPGQGQSLPIYYLDVEGGRYETGSSGYQVAPDAGIVRLYYLPRSKRVVNLELLPDRPIPDGQTPIGTVKDLGRAMLRRDEVGKADARAEMAAFGHQFEAATHQPDAPPAAGEGDPRPLAQAIVGAWSNQLATVTFGADGSLTIAGMMGLPLSQTGQWAIDGEGRLTADALQLMGPGGRPVPQSKHDDKHHRHDPPAAGAGNPAPAADAWISGDNLTIHFGEYTLTFQRQGAPAPS